MDTQTKIKRLEADELISIETGKALLLEHSLEYEKLNAENVALEECKALLVATRHAFSNDPQAIDTLQQCEADVQRQARVLDAQEAIYHCWLKDNQRQISEVRGAISSAVYNRYKLTRPAVEQEIEGAFRNAVNSLFPPASKRRISVVLGFETEPRYRDELAMLRDFLTSVDISIPAPIPHGIEDPDELPGSVDARNALDRVIAEAAKVEEQLHSV